MFVFFMCMAMLRAVKQSKTAKGFWGHGRVDRRSGLRTPPDSSVLNRRRAISVFSTRNTLKRNWALESIFWQGSFRRGLLSLPPISMLPPIGMGSLRFGMIGISRPFLKGTVIDRNARNNTAAHVLFFAFGFQPLW